MATVPNPRTWVASESATAAKFNTDIRDGYEFFLAPPRAILRRSLTNQAIVTNTETAISWDSEEIDTDGGHSTATNPTRYTAQTAGWYWLSATIQWPQIGPNYGMIEAVLRKNGTSGNRQGRSDMFPHSTEAAFHITAGHMQLNVGDYVEVMVYQETGVNRDVGQGLGSPDPLVFDPRFEIRWVRS